MLCVNYFAWKMVSVADSLLETAHISFAFTFFYKSWKFLNTP